MAEVNNKNGRTRYKEKLLDPRWQRCRLEILNRDNFRCRYCNDDKTELHVHHLKYQGEPWEGDLQNKITVCKTCHSVVEFIKSAYTSNGWELLKVRNAKIETHVYHSVLLLLNPEFEKMFFILDHKDGSLEDGLFVSLENMKEVVEFFDKA